MYNLSVVLSPLFIGLVSAAFFLFLVSSISLVRNLTQRRRERPEGKTSIRPRRPGIVLSLFGIGLSLLVMLGAFLTSLTVRYPLAIFASVLAGIVFVFSISLVISDLRKVQRERREGHLLTWHRRPELVMRIGLAFSTFGLLLQMGFSWYTEAQGYPHPSLLAAFLIDSNLGYLVPFFFVFLGWSLFIYGAYLRSLQQR